MTESERPGASDTPRLAAADVTLRYDRTTISEGLSVQIPDERVTVIIGPNGCGKSTLLRALARLLKPTDGAVLLDGEDIASLPAKEVSRRLGLLPQSPTAPEGIRVGELVARGRHPYQGVFRQWSRQDQRIVEEAMEATGVREFASRLVDELSGGQRQRVWMAMALAQDVPMMLLDEPTSYLDIAHQVDLLELCVALNRTGGRTVVAVLHDLNHACRYADHIIAMRDGAIVAEGAPGDIVTAELVEQVFGLPCRIIADPETGTPLVVPRARPIPAA